MQYSVHFSAVQLLSHIWLFAIPGTAARQTSLSITSSWSLFKLMSIKLMSHPTISSSFIPFQPSIFPSIRVFSNESLLHIRWPEYWSFSISPSNEYSWLIFFRIHWFLRWLRNRTGRPLSPQKIHQKIIWIPSKCHKTNSERWRRTPGTRKTAHCLRKEVGQNIKHKKRGKRVRDGDLSRKGVVKEEKFPNTRRPSHHQVYGEFWNLKGQHNWEEK